MVDANEMTKGGRLCCIAALATLWTLLCSPERASADPAAAVQVTRAAVPALALGVTHPRIVAAAAPEAARELVTPLNDPFTVLGRRASALYRNGLEIGSEVQPERLHLLFRSNRGGGALCVRYRY